MTQLGRISGPLLEANLERQGVDLTFRNYSVSDDILYLDVTNNKISVNTLGSNELNVNSTIRTTNLLDPTQATVDRIVVNTNTFSTTLGGITITPNQTNPLMLMDHMKAGNIDFKDNIIKNYVANGSIVLDPSGTGTTQVLGSARVNGDLTVTGSMQVDGNLSGASRVIVGDQPMDTVTIVPDFTQSIIPGDNVTWDLGKSNLRWRNAYIHDNSGIGSLTYNSFTISDQLQVDGPTATITTLQSNDPVLLNPTSGITDVERIRFNGNTITNLDATALTVNSTGIGYVRFTDTSAVVVPAGNIAARPANPEEGDTRWNTQNPINNYLECFDGTVWSPAVGAGGNISVVDMEDLGNAFILILG
jgi:hypothetical protein